MNLLCAILLCVSFVPDFLAPRGYVCPRAAVPPSLDGSLQDAVWASAPWSADFVDIEGDRKPTPRFRTRVKMLWDDSCLYIGAELEEPHLQASLTEHDSVIFHDNDFEVFIDPDGDGHLYSELELNALNTTWDLLLPKPYRAGGPPLDGWELAGLKTAVHLEGTLNDPSDLDRGWTVEIAIPWKALAQTAQTSFPPNPGDHWRINFSRVQWHWDVVEGRYVKRPGLAEDNWVWSPQGVIDMHRPERWGYLQFEKEPSTPLRPLEGWREQQELAQVWIAEDAYRAKNGRYTADASDLGLDPHRFHLEATSRQFTAELNGFGVDQSLRFWKPGGK